MGGHVSFIIFYVIFTFITIYYATAMDYSVFEAGGAPDLSPITIENYNIIGILTAAYIAIVKFIFLATVVVLPEMVVLGAIYLALNIAMIYIVIDTILP